jgi:hypothetical protein
VDYRELVDKRALSDEEELPWIGGKDKRKEEVGKVKEEKKIHDNSNGKEEETKQDNTNKRYNIVEN